MASERSEKLSRVTDGYEIALAGSLSPPEATVKPLAQEPSPDCSDRQGSEACKRVLIVDDEPNQTELLKMLFELEGFEAAVADNGGGALAQIHKVRPHVIVTDFMMPRMNGGEMARIIRALPQYATLPVVMTSATDARQVEPYLPYYDVFLRKPYRWEELLLTTRQLMERSRSVDQGETPAEPSGRAST